MFVLFFLPLDGIQTWKDSLTEVTKNKQTKQNKIESNKKKLGQNKFINLK